MSPGAAPEGSDLPPEAMGEGEITTNIDPTSDLRELSVEELIELDRAISDELLVRLQDTSVGVQ